LGDFSIEIMDYVIHRKANNLAFTGISQGVDFPLELSNFFFVKSIFFSYITKKMNNRQYKYELCNVNVE
jgi:hypothetical protein